MTAGDAGRGGEAQVCFTGLRAAGHHHHLSTGPSPEAPACGDKGSWNPPQLSLCHVPTSSRPLWVVRGPGAVALREGCPAVAGIWGLSLSPGGPCGLKSWQIFPPCPHGLVAFSLYCPPPKARCSRSVGRRCCLLAAVGGGGSGHPRRRWVAGHPRRWGGWAS